MKAVAALVAALAAGVAIGVGGPVALAIALAPVGFLVGFVDWRWAIYGLLAYLPLSGLATVAFYDPDASTLEGGLPTVMKDLFFVAPAYAGFALAAWRRRRWPNLGGLPLAPIAVLTVLVLLGALNPRLPNQLVAIIGIKVWLFYIPLYVLGFHLVRSRESLRRVLVMMAAFTVVPAAVGILEAVLFYSGQERLVYSAYGAAAADVTQQFVVLSFGEGGLMLRRVPSTFSFFVQYFGFLMAMVGVAWAWWRGFRAPAGRGGLGLALMLLVVTAAFTSGSRNAYLSVPLVIGLALLLSPAERHALRASRSAQVAGGIVSVMVVVSLLGLGLLQKSLSLVRLSFDSVIIAGFREAVGRGNLLFGGGTGTNTPPARRAAPEIDAVYIDSWLVKCLVELGVLGLIAAVLVFGSVLWTAVRAHRSLSDPRLAAASAGILAVLVWVIINTVKGFFLDVDPIAVYFWLFAGVLSGIAALGARERPAEDDVAPAAQPAAQPVAPSV